MLWCLSQLHPQGTAASFRAMIEMKDVLVSTKSVDLPMAIEFLCVLMADAGTGVTGDTPGDGNFGMWRIVGVQAINGKSMAMILSKKKLGGGSQEYSKIGHLDKRLPDMFALHIQY